MSTALARPDAGDALTAARRWIDWDPSERRRRAAEACRDRDAELLWELTEAVMVLYGRAGARVSAHTCKAYRSGITALMLSWQHVPLLHPTRDHAALWLRDMEAAGLAPKTVTVRLAAGRALYRALRWALNSGNEKDAGGPDPFKDVRPAADPTPAWAKRQPYSQADVDRLLAVATGSDRLLILLTAHGGLRVSEALALTAADVDLIDERLTVRKGKGGKMRQVRLSRTLADELGSPEF